MSVVEGMWNLLKMEWGKKGRQTIGGEIKLICRRMCVVNARVAELAVNELVRLKGKTKSNNTEQERVHGQKILTNSEYYIQPHSHIWQNSDENSKIK